MSTIHGGMAEGLWHRFHGRTGESLVAFEMARAMAGENFCWNGHTILTLPAVRSRCGAAVGGTEGVSRAPSIVPDRTAVARCVKP